MKIDWKLTSNGDVAIDTKDNLVEYKDGMITYVDEYGTHVVDTIRHIYERRHPDNIFRVSFDEELLTVIFDNENLKYDINAKYEIDGNKIKMTYSLGEEVKILEITKKED